MKMPALGYDALALLLLKLRGRLSGLGAFLSTGNLATELGVAIVFNYSWKCAP